jgi:predicted enzyme related to lactoylglutathione lyase
MDVMEFGRMAFVGAPGGGVFGLWQAGIHNGIALANEPGALTWNEFMTRDYEGAKRFFAEAFGYTYTDMGGGGFEYSTIEVEGKTVGGIGGMPAEVPAEVPAHWRVYFSVENCDQYVERVTELGGRLLRPAQDSPYGRMADVADPQGAPFSIIQPPEAAG